MERNDKTIAKICQKKQNAHHCKWFAKQQVLHAKLLSESEFEKFLKVYPPSYTHSYTMMTKQHTNIWTKESVPKCSNLCRYYYYYSLRVVAIWVMFQVSKNQKKKNRESPPEENLTYYKTTTTKGVLVSQVISLWMISSAFIDCNEQRRPSERGYNEFIT